jgi:D-xylose transport system permease protein
VSGIENDPSADGFASRRGLSVTETLREQAQRVKGGEMGSLPAFLALIVLTILFARLSPFFLTKLNIANLFVQAAELTVLSAAMVFLIILTEIDLSAGVTGGTAMALFIQLVKSGTPWPFALLAGVFFGAATGAVLGFFVAKIGIPAFAMTLAFFLGYQGLMLTLLGDGQLYRIEIKPLKAIMNGNLTTWGGWLMLAVLFILAAGLGFYDRRRRSLRGLPNKPIGFLAAKLALIAVGGSATIAFLNTNRSKSAKPILGVPIVVPIVLAILIIGTFVLDRTRFGRYIYAVGGNPEAARRAGINVTMIRIAGFVICSTMSVISGLFHATRVGSIESTAGRQIVLSGVGAAVVGGVSLFGGRGRLSSAAIGAMVFAMIENGLGLLGLKAGINFIVTASVLVLAVTVDALSRKRGTSQTIRR